MMKDVFLLLAEFFVLLVLLNSKEAEKQKPLTSSQMWAVEVKDEAGEACRRSFFFEQKYH